MPLLYLCFKKMSLWLPCIEQIDRGPEETLFSVCQSTTFVKAPTVSCRQNQGTWRKARFFLLGSQNLCQCTYVETSKDIRCLECFGFICKSKALFESFGDLSCCLEQICPLTLKALGPIGLVIFYYTPKYLANHVFLVTIFIG